MAEDANGRKPEAGDKVIIPATVRQVFNGETPKVGLELSHGQRTVIDSKQVEKRD